MDKPYIVGIGGANLDICGRTEGPMLLKDSNIGSIHLSAGGVCRNICENAVRLGGNVRLISAVGADANGQILLQACKAVGLDTDCVSVMEGQRTGSYLSIHGEDGDMMTAINDMEIISSLTPELLGRFQETLVHSNAIVVDANLPEATLKWICETYGQTKPIFADTVSCAKAQRLLPVLHHLHTLKPNLMEAQLLTGAESAEDCAVRLLDLGVKNICISAGSRGVYYRNEAEGFWVCPRPLEDVANATGAGDSLMGALLAGYVAEMPLKKRIQFAVTASVLTIQSKDTIRKDLSEKLVLDSIKECIAQ